MGRFISTDPLDIGTPSRASEQGSRLRSHMLLNPATLNMFSYAFNSPQNYFDPTGRVPDNFFNSLSNAAEIIQFYIAWLRSEHASTPIRRAVGWWKDVAEEYLPSPSKALPKAITDRVDSAANELEAYANYYQDQIEMWLENLTLILEASSRAMAGDWEGAAADVRMVLHHLNDPSLDGPTARVAVEVNDALNAAEAEIQSRERGTPVPPPRENPSRGGPLQEPLFPSTGPWMPGSPGSPWTPCYACGSRGT